MLREVVRIELQECPNESSALVRESELLQTLRPKFNRAGTWPAPLRFFAWRSVDQQLHLAMTETPDSDWRLHGPLGGGAVRLHAVLARLLWVAVQPQLGFAALPVGWPCGQLEKEATIHCGLMIKPVASSLEKLLCGQHAEFCDWIRTRLSGDLHPFENASLEADLEFITETFGFEDSRPSTTNH